MTATIRSAAKRALCGRHFISGTRINRDSRPQRACKTFEARLGDMMVIAAVQGFGVQCDAGVHGKGLEPFLHQLRIKFADLVAHEFGLEYQKRTPGNVDSDPGQRLIHRHMHIGVTRDALHVAKRLLHRLTKRDADVLGGMVMVDVQVALGLDRDVDARVPREQIEHVIEKANTGRDRRATRAIEIDFDLNVGFLGLSLDGGLAHANIPYSRAFYQGFGGFATSVANGLQTRCAMPRSRKSWGPKRMSSNELPSWHGTTILTVRKGGLVVIGGDGQVTIGQTIVKSNAKKVRRLGKGDVIGGFAGATADAFTLFERLEAKLEQYPAQLTRAAVELAKDWRTDRYLRRLEAMMIVADAQVSLVLTGTGDVLEPESGIMGIGSGGNYALAAARAMIDGPLDAEAIVRKSLDIAAEICVFTNRNVTIESLKS